jgi:hypothetical protein
MIKLLVDALGWAGAILVLAAYAAVSFRKIRPDAVLYQVANGLGGVLLVINTVYYHAYPSAFVNVVWIGIALAARIHLKSHDLAKGDALGPET